jgi:hypothetical protein
LNNAIENYKEEMKKMKESLIGTDEQSNFESQHETLQMSLNGSQL